MEIEGFVGPASRLILKMVDPALEHKRLTVSKMAKLTPLEALTVDERQHLAQMMVSIFETYDEDKSGKLDRQEFHKCLTESKMGFTERQIAHLMYVANACAIASICPSPLPTYSPDVRLELRATHSVLCMSKL